MRSRWGSPAAARRFSKPPYGDEQSCKPGQPEKTTDLIAAGPSIIGDCCGTTPEHIRRIKEAVEM
jgi:methionine synthase I (cobalamin-dependent)